MTGKPPLPPGIKIGKSVHIDATARLDWRYGRHIELMDYVTIGDGARILCHDRSSLHRIGAIRVAPVIIKKGAFIGADSIILPGVTIGENAMIAAGAVVTKNVESNIIMAGNPARPIGRVNDLDEKRRREMKTVDVFHVGHYDRKVLPESYKAKQENAILDNGVYYVYDEGSVIVDDFDINSRELDSDL